MKKTLARIPKARLTDDQRASFALAEVFRLRAHAPYSNFRVGVVVVTKAGQKYGGGNRESASYGLTMCGEDNALGAMTGAGDCSGVVEVFVVAEPTDGGVATPCGACRQVLYEAGTVMVYMARPGADWFSECDMDTLLPFGFGLEKPKSTADGVGQDDSAADGGNGQMGTTGASVVAAT